MPIVVNAAGWNLPYCLCLLVARDTRGERWKSYVMSIVIAILAEGAVGGEHCRHCGSWYMGGTLLPLPHCR